MSRAKNYLSDLELGMSVKKWEGAVERKFSVSWRKRVIMMGGHLCRGVTYKMALEVSCNEMVRGTTDRQHNNIQRYQIYIRREGSFCIWENAWW